MKIIIHVGMPKCGSTSIQNQLTRDHEKLRDEFGIFYRPNNSEFQNHTEIAREIANQSDQSQLEKLLLSQIEAAKTFNCETIVISSEDIFFHIGIPESMQHLAETLSKVGFDDDQITYVMVYRKLFDYFNSSLKQLSANGEALKELDFLAHNTYTLLLIERFFTLSGKRISISLDHATKTGGLLKVFYEQVLGINHIGKERRDNAWGARGFGANIIAGQLVGLYARLNRLHPNEPLADEYRVKVQSLIDDAAEDPSVGTFLARLEKLFTTQLENAFTLGLESMPDDVRHLKQSLEKATITTIAANENSTFLSAPSLIPSTFIEASIRTTQPSDTTNNDNEIQRLDGLSTLYGSFACFSGDLISNFLRLYGEWARLETDFLLENLPIGRRIVDVGAYIGTFSLSIAQSHPRKIVCIEANSSALPVLEKNLSLNYQGHYRIVHAAVALDRSLTSGNYADHKNLGSFRLTEQNHDEAPVSAKPINCLTLREIREAHGDYDFIKLDIEGGESDALLSDFHWLKTNKPIIWAECNEDPHSLALFEVLQAMKMDIYFYRYPAINPNNYNSNNIKIFPVAYEAGLLAVRPNTTIAVPTHAIASGAACIRITATSDLQRALWLTPRWGMAGWANLDRTELLAVCSHLATGRDGLDRYLTPESELAERYKLNQKLAERQLDANAFTWRLTPSGGNLKRKRDHWYVYPPHQLSDSELIEAFLGIGEDIENPKNDSDDEIQLLHHQRALSLIGELEQRSQPVADWINVYKHKHLREAAGCAFRLAGATTTADPIETNIQGWERAVTLLRPLQALSGSDTALAWVTDAYQVSLREAGAGYNRMATISRQERADNFTEMASHWEKGSSFLSELLLLNADQPSWLTDLLHHQLLEGGVAFDKAAQTCDSRQAATLWKRGSAMLHALVKQQENQPTWVHESLKRQLLESGIAFCKAAKAENNGTTADILPLHIQAATQLCELITLYGQQPNWVTDYLTEHALHAVNALELNSTKSTAAAQEVAYLDDACTLIEHCIRVFPAEKLIARHSSLLKQILDRSRLTTSAANSMRADERARIFEAGAKAARRISTLNASEIDQASLAVDLETYLRSAVLAFNEAARAGGHSIVAYRTRTQELLRELLSNFPNQPNEIVEMYTSECANLRMNDARLHY